MTEHVTVFARSPQLKLTEKIVIKDFLKELELFCLGDKFSSETFMLGNTPLEIDIYPNGHIWDKDDGKLVMFLCNKSKASSLLLISSLTMDFHWADMSAMLSALKLTRTRRTLF